jgi:hypothetical protein
LLCWVAILLEAHERSFYEEGNLSESDPEGNLSEDGADVAGKSHRIFSNGGQGWTTGDMGNLKRFYHFKSADNSSIAG